jgi:hypothetical protein
LAAVGDEMADVGNVGDADDEITSKEKVISSELRLFRRLSVVPNMPSHHTLFSFSIVLYFNEDYVCQNLVLFHCFGLRGDHANTFKKKGQNIALSLDVFSKAFLCGGSIVVQE